MRDPIGRRIQEDPRLAEQEYSQGGTYVQGASMPRKREYPGGNGNDDDNRRPYRDRKPPERERYPNQHGRPPGRGGYPEGGPPDGNGGPRGKNGGPPDGGGPPGDGGPLDLLVDKDHQVLKDPLDQ